MSKEDCSSFVMIAWSIWHSRNIALYQHQMMDPQNVLCKAEAGWIPPDIHWYKLNVDAETDVSNGITGLGAIKRNSKGDFMAASARKKSFLGDVEIAGAEAVLQCIKLATDSGFSPLIVESDSANKHAKVNK